MQVTLCIQQWVASIPLNKVVFSTLICLVFPLQAKCLGILQEALQLLSMSKAPKMKLNFSSVAYNSKLVVYYIHLYLILSSIEMDLYNYFSQYGSVADVIVMRDKATGRGRGFGFVKMIFKDDDEA